MPAGPYARACQGPSSPSSGRPRCCGCFGRAPRPSPCSRSSAALGLAKGTAHGILRTLVDVGFVGAGRGDGPLRRRGPPRVAGRRHGWTPTPSGRMALNWADTLAARAGEQVRVGVLRGVQVEVVHHVFRPDDSEQQMHTGDMLPVHATAMGKVLLAHSARDPGPRARRAPGALHPPHGHRPAGHLAPPGGGPARRHRDGGRGAGPRPGRGRRPGPRDGAAWSWPRWRCPVTWSGCATVGGRCGPGSSPTSAGSRAPCPGTARVSAPDRYVAAIDQGTTSTRCILFDAAGRLASVAQREHRQHYPAPGLGRSTTPRRSGATCSGCVPEALAQVGARPDQVVALGDRQPAGDHGAVGPADGRAGRPRGGLAGHAHPRP